MHHYGRLKAVCLGTPADGGGWTIWKGRLCDNDAYCMSKCARTPECICADALNRNYVSKGKGRKRCSAANSTGFWENLLCGAWYLKSTCKSLLERAFYVRIDQSLFTPIDPDLVKCSPHSALYRDSTLSLHCTFYSFVLSSSLPSAENVIAFTVTCHFLFISRDDKALTFGIHRRTHTRAYIQQIFFFFSCHWKIRCSLHSAEATFHGAHKAGPFYS